MTEKTLILVLGMHRSGTSAATRGLHVLGAETGRQLLPPVAGNNDRGFFEDREVSALNDAVLARVGSRWDDLQFLEPAALDSPEMEGLRGQALRLLRSRMDAHPRFALKDPRMCRLLPFWAPVLDSLQVQLNFLLVVRNPLSVARSLARRDGFAPQKTYWLWLQHMAGAAAGLRRWVRQDAGPCLQVLAYERLMDQPMAELSRIAHAFGLPLDHRGGAYAAFACNFLDHALEHSRHAAEDLATEPAIPALLATAYGALSSAACDRIDAAQALRAMLDVHGAMQSMSGVLALAGMLDTEHARLLERMERADAQLRQQLHSIAERDRTIGTLRNALSSQENRLEADRDQAAMTEAVADLRRSLERMDAGVSERLPVLEHRLDALVAQTMELAGHAKEWNAAVMDAHRSKVEQLEATLTERTTELLRLSRAFLDLQASGARHRTEAEHLAARLAGARTAVRAFDSALRRARSTLTWRLLAWVRGAGRLPALMRIGWWRERMDARVVARSGLFSANWYLQAYPDVAADGQDPLCHYLQRGAAEGRDPGPDFSTRAYLSEHPDVAVTGANPLVHYLRHGRQEGRRVRASTMPILNELQDDDA